MKHSVAICLAFFCFVGVVTAVSAHAAQLVKSNPENGAILDEVSGEVFARFSEEIVYPDSWLKVFNSAGEQVDSGDGGVDLNSPERDSLIATLPASLPEAVYTVEWQVTLLDGDTTDGAFTFTVGTPAATSSENENSPQTQTDLSTTITWIATGIGLILTIVLAAYIWRNKVY